MGSKACVVFLLAVLIVIALALAGGSMEAAPAGKGRRPYGARHLATAVLGVEVRRRVLGSISPSSLDPNRAACIGSCPAAGGAYTGRGCQKVYQCSSG
ncbi:uncharacterized protein C2845_PM15G05090 [Panicum miliaceum]|uniref:Uncharacterized protein n=1 Tax=Panicum miliaceum TaxID=4540 RepID=A0A3L6Q947_PANMI|nr:uncharacterized protein C2845_PM15G05090 [Panicum miliaceum]